MRIRIAALVVFGLASGCGDSAAPSDTVPAAVVTISGSLNSTDTMTGTVVTMNSAVDVPSSGFSVIIRLMPVKPRGTISFTGVAATFPLPYSVSLYIAGPGQLTDTTFTSGTIASVEILDSLALASMFAPGQSTSLNPPIPYAGGVLESDSGRITIEHVDSLVVTGAFDVRAKDKLGRSVTAVARFTAQRLQLPAGLGLASTSPPFPSRARR